MKKTIFIFSFLLIICLCGCGQNSAPADAAAPTPIPAPSPTPFQEPVLDKGGLVSFDGKELSASYLKDGEQYVKLSEAVEAIGSELIHDSGSEIFTFPWRSSNVILTAGSKDIEYLEEQRALSAESILCDGGNDLYVPAESFCTAAELGLFYDEEFDHLYCTPGAGDWALPQGYNVPVMMYHGIQRNAPGANLFVDPISFEEQLKYLTENGYTTIFFEDLWHVQDFEKPVILTFDDGWENNYTAMLPILEKYNCKATIFIVEDFVHDTVTNHVSFDYLHALADSELISLQSHTVTHDYLSSMSAEDQQWQLTESKRFLTRETGKEPFVLAYPSGDQNDVTLDLVREYYRFGVKMMTYPYSCYNTSDDPTLVYRYFPERETPLSTYISWLEEAFAEKSSDGSPAA